MFVQFEYTSFAKPAFLRQKSKILDIIRILNELWYN